jgi:hypothetical protein
MDEAHLMTTVCTGCGKIRNRTGKTYPFDKLRAGSQGLKPDVFSIIYGPTKVVP